MRPIDADAFKKYIDAQEGRPFIGCTVGEAMKILIDEQPTVQPETAKRIVGKSRDGMTLWYQCDTCNEPVDEKDAFCRGCGRRLVDG